MKEATVINIMSNTELIINYGLADGATIGQKIRIIERGESIVNLKGEELGTLDAIKEELEITQVYDHFSICQKLIREETYTPILAAISQLNIKQVHITVDTLNVNPKDITGQAPPRITPIKKGDIAEILYNKKF